MADDALRAKYQTSNHGQDNRSVTTPANVRRAEQMRQASQLRAAGATFREIGEALGIDATTARRHILDTLDRAAYEDATLMRTLEGERLDRLQRGLWAAATSGDTDAARTVVRIMERRAKLFGLDSPTKIEMTADIDAQILALAAHIGLEGGDDAGVAAGVEILAP
jgi:hypothetical protein